MALAPEQLPATLDATEARRAAIARRVRVTTPDPRINAAVPAICAAADGLWEPPVYMHGGVAWHMPYLGWRGAYIGSEFGWHDRAKLHFRAFAKCQIQEPATGKPRPDPKYNLARQAADSTINSRGGIPHHPVKGMRSSTTCSRSTSTSCLWHLLWTGDLEFAREMWPVLTAHLAWEKRCFDPDDDGLYENYANTMISDAHHYSGGACTQASAYNYRALRMAARLAKLLGKDPAPFDREADKTLAAMNRVLWMPELGWYAEYRDLLGLKRLHPSAELPSVYHPIDSDVPDRFQAYQMLRYVDTAIEHVPIEGDSAVVWTSNWVPYIWSIAERAAQRNGAYGAGLLAGRAARDGLESVSRGDSRLDVRQPRARQLRRHLGTRRRVSRRGHRLQLHRRHVRPRHWSRDSSASCRTCSTANC